MVTGKVRRGSGWVCGGLVVLVLFLALAFSPVAVVRAATLTVMNCKDDGSTGSLRQVLGAAAAGDTITFAQNCNGASAPNTTITLGSMLTPAVNVTIDATVGGRAVTIDGNRAVRLFRVTSGITLGLSGLTLTRGGGGNGGAIGNEGGTLHITGSTFSANFASNNFGEGGAIENSFSGTVNITNSTFSTNTVSPGGLAGAILNNTGTVNITNSTFSGNNGGNFGGAIYNGGTVNITGSTFSANSASTGGAIDNESGILTVTNSTLSGNNAPNAGGGIYNNGGTVTVTNSTVTNNSATIEGGSIYNNGSGGTVTVTNSTLSANSVTNGPGGGIYNDGGTVTVTNSTFSANSATNGGGGIYNNISRTLTITNSTFSGNSAAGGGGIYNGGTATLTNAIVANSPTGGDLRGTFGGGNNLIDDTSGTLTGSRNITGTPALLGTLAVRNGGTAQTYDLLAGSPALDAGDAATCAAPSPNGAGGRDQNGTSRPQPAGALTCDIGAFESALTTAAPCQPGSSSASGLTPCTLAPAGSFVATSGATAATPCPAGTFSATAGATTCTSAPAGSYVDAPGATSATRCAPGTYQDQPGKTNCAAAPAGSFATGPGAAVAAPCPAGSFSATTGASACTPAPTGSSVPGVGATSATACVAGTYQALIGQTSCTSAPAGSYVAGPGAVSATLCPAGSFSATTGATACTPAPAGSYVPVSGATVAILCPTGTFSAAGATVCTAVTDTTAPTTTAALGGTKGSNGYYTSAVALTLTATDPDDPAANITTTYRIDALPAVQYTGPFTVTGDGSHTVTFFSTDKAGNAEKSQTLTFLIDATKPTVTYAGNANTYAADQTVAITCTASDAPSPPQSGIASTTCTDISGPAYTFKLGTNSYSATAMDKAGNTGSGSTSFKVTVTPSSLGGATIAAIEESAKFKALPPAQQALVRQLGTALVQQLANLPNLTPAQKARVIAAYKAGVNDLARQGWLTHAQASALIAMTAGL